MAFATSDMAINVALAENLTLRDVLSGKSGHTYPLNAIGLVEYARRQQCLETIEFLQDVYNLVQRGVQPFELLQQVERIADTYIVAGSSNEINIPGSMRRRTLDRVAALKQAITATTKSAEGLLQVFDDCVEEVESMFEKDAFPRFIKECTRRHNLAISRDMCFWWTRRPLRLFGFPNPVNQLEARSHSGCVTLLTILHIIFLYEFAVPWLGWYILYGFAARFLSGPRIDPQAYFVIFVVRPLLEDVLQVARSEFHPSPPKRFAQFVGLLFALAGNILYNVLHLTVPSIMVWGCLVVAAGLLALTGFCAACFVFSVGMRLGLVPKTVCESCAYSYTKSCPRPGTTARVHPYQAPTDTSGDET